jgi:hypothetical protein
VNLVHFTIVGLPHLLYLKGGESFFFHLSHSHQSNFKDVSELVTFMGSSSSLYLHSFLVH